MMKRYIAFILISASACLILSGCGETAQGIGKDASRIGRGVSTVIFRQD